MADSDTANYMTSRSYTFLRNIITEKINKIIELENTIKNENNERSISRSDIKSYVLNTKWTYSNLTKAFLGLN
jgi:putative flippase GtrA